MRRQADAAGKPPRPLRGGDVQAAAQAPASAQTPISHSLDPYLSPISALGAHPENELPYASDRNLPFDPDLAISEIGIFAEQELVCCNPKGRDVVDRRTGEITRVPHLNVDARTGEARPMRCGSNSCAACAVWNARRIAGAIRLADPQSQFTLTLVGHDHATIRTLMKWLLDSLRAAVAEVELAWAAEPNPAGTGTHVHGYLHTGDTGRVVNCPEMAKALAEAGIYTIFRLDPVPRGAGSNHMSYPMKCLSDPDLREPFLILNGTPKRLFLIHSTRGFWRDGAGGEKLTRREAEKRAYRRSGAWARWACE
jgi:hypothetical protein